MRLIVVSLIIACAVLAYVLTPIGSAAPSSPASQIRSVPLESTEFASRSRLRQGTLFTIMPPGSTGVVADTKYADPKMWVERYQELSYGEMGTGVAIGDYDGDGRPDIFVVSNSGQSRLFPQSRTVEIRGCDGEVRIDLRRDGRY